MKEITIKTPVKFEVDEICKAMDFADVISLISHAANHFAENKPHDYSDRRLAMIKIADHGLSENGKRFVFELAGLIAADYGPNRERYFPITHNISVDITNDPL